MKPADTSGELDMTLKMNALFLRNVWLFPNYTAFQPKRPYSSTLSKHPELYKYGRKRSDIHLQTIFTDDGIYFPSFYQPMLLALVL
jgi:hypothetical protein